MNINALSNLDEVGAAYKQLTVEEDAVNGRLQDLLSRQVELEAKLRTLSSSARTLTTAKADADKLGNVIGFTARLAEGVSVKVRQLDRAKSRVSECQRRVQDLIDLKLCSDGVKTALRDEDYEQAAGHVHRFLAMDASLLNVSALDSSDDSNAASLEAAVETLKQAEVTVNQVVSKRFDEAVAAEDHASIERFFKIFPLINMHDEGLKKFTATLCSKIVETSKANLKQALETPSTDQRANVIFADTITLLFEGIARTVEIHQPLIETYYGPGRLYTVIAMLQEQCDAESEKIVAEFRRKRNVKEQRARVRDAMYGNVNASSAALTSASSASLASKVAPKDIDALINEMILLQARAEMYYKFVRKRITADVEVSTEEGSDARQEKMTALDGLWTKSRLCHTMQDLLADYILFEDYFMAQNIRKAMESDSEEMLDDVFFLAKKCVQRSIAGQNVDGVCAVINNACGILEQDVCGLFSSQLKMGFPSGYLDLTHAYNVLHSSYQQGKLQAGDTERQKIVFINALNNPDNARDYVNRLTDTLKCDVDALVKNRSELEKAKLDTCLSAFPNVTAKLKVVLDQGLQQLRQSAIKPRIKPWVDGFVSHDINDEQFADYEANDPFIQGLIMNLDGLLRGFKTSLTTNNCDALVSILTSEVTSQLEKAITKSKFSRLGGLLLDREIRSLVSFLSGATTWSIRERFGRLSQIASALNVESVVEMSEMSGQNWILTHAEIRQILALR